MVDRSTVEERVGFLLNKLNDFRSVANNLTTEEQKVVDDVSSALTDLGDFVKLPDTKPDGISKFENQELDGEFQQLTLKISALTDKESPGPYTPQLHTRRPSAQVRLKSLRETLSKVQKISKIYEVRLDKLKKKEGSSVTKSTPGDPVKFDIRKEGLIHWLLMDDIGRKDVLVIGSGGSGKTALVRKVCEDVRVGKHFGTIAWISIPPINDPDSIRHEIFLQLLFENKAAVPDHLSASDVNDQMLKHQIISLLQKERCLIVVDNLVDQSTLQLFQNVRHLVESGRVIFIARREREPWIRDTRWHGLFDYPLTSLSEEDSWAFFHSKTFPEGDVPSGLKEVCQGIVRECRGLPEAIDLFSRLLRNKKERCYEGERMIPLSKLFHDFIILIQQILNIIYKNDQLGSCLLYLSIFPENSQISCKRISRLWAAEGFLYGSSGYSMRIAESFLQTLLDRKWIHPEETRSDGGLSTFRVNNLVREIIVSLSDHHNLLRITREGSTNWPQRVRYLSDQGGTVKDLNEEKLSLLHSLFVFDVSSNKDDTATSEASPSGMSKNPLYPFNFKLLKVLDLTGAPLQIAPDALFELILLRYLSLRDTPIEVIPGSIGRLMHLEFLDLKHSSVTELPKQAEGLERIRHILIYHHKKDPLMEMESYNLIGFEASCRIGRLKCLEKLCFVESDNNMLSDLGNLTKLRRLGIVKLREEHGKLLCSALEKLELLESLNVHALDEDEIIDLCHEFLPPNSLKHLYLHGRLEKLPDWISSLNNLTKIILRWSQVEVDLLATLGKLEKLVELELHRAYDGEQLDFKKGQFRTLKILLLEELEGLRSMSLEEGTLPSLENLTVCRCQWLERIPSGIEHILTIRKLAFFDMSDEFYKKVREDHEKDNYRNFEHISEVYFTRWRAGHWETHLVDSTDQEVGSTDEE